MADTRIEDRRRAFTAHAKEAHPDWSDEQIAELVDRQVKDSIASAQKGSQVWMNRPAGLTVEQYKDLADRIRALFTDDELKAMSSAESAKAFALDPAGYLARWGKYSEFLSAYLTAHP